MKKKLFKFLVLILAIKGLFDITTCSIMRYPEHKTTNVVHYFGPITDEELDKFLPVWSEFINVYGDRGGASEVSLNAGNPSKMLPEDIVKWVRKKNWDVDRFFFVEQRLHDLVNYIHIRNHSKDVIKVMRNTLKNEKNKATRANIEKVIATQQKIISVRGLNESEVAAVEKHLPVILSIMKE